MTALEDARRDLRAALGDEAVLFDPLALKLYARDASMVEGSAGLVVFPRSTQDIVTCVNAAAAHGCPWSRAGPAPGWRAAPRPSATPSSSSRRR